MTYAIAVELDADHLGESYNHVVAEVGRVLAAHGFEWQHGLYLGGTCVTAVLAVIDLTRRVPRFASTVRTIRLLRITDVDDLMPVVRQLATS